MLSAILSPSPAFLYLLLLQVGGYALALLGVLLSRAGLSLPIVSQLSSFLIGNYGLLLGVLRALARQRVTSYRNE